MRYVAASRRVNCVLHLYGVMLHTLERGWGKRCFIFSTPVSGLPRVTRRYTRTTHLRAPLRSDKSDERISRAARVQIARTTVVWRRARARERETAQNYESNLAVMEFALGRRRRKSAGDGLDDRRFVLLGNLAS